MKFLTKAKLQLEYIEDGVKWYTLKEDLIFGDFTVPKDLFFTDLATVPKGLRWLYKPDGKYTSSAILHDYLYSCRDLKRKYCDRMFLDAMKSEGVDFITRYNFYFAVRLFGWRYR